MIFEGSKLEGSYLDVAENFNSIPGLWTGLDARYRIQADGNKISLAGDGSPELNNFTQPSEIRKPTYVDGKWIQSLASSTSAVSLKSERKDFTFLHNGEAFGLYFIVNFEENTGTQNYSLITTGSNSDTCIQFTISVTGSIIVTVRNAGTIIRSITQINLYTDGHANELTLPGTHIISHVFKGANISNNQILRINDLVNINTDASILSEYDAGLMKQFNIFQSANQTKFLKGGMFLVYNWTGKTPTEIDAYDVRVRSLLNSIKPEFT